MKPVGQETENLPQKSLLLQAIRAALLAGEEILKIYQTDFRVEFKDDSSPLTQADKNAHHAIAGELTSLRIPILSEEGVDIPYSERSAYKALWIVDPLDGTKEFVKRNGEFTVNIALVQEQLSVLGVIYQPTAHLLYFGCTTLGSYKLSNCLPDFQVPEILDDLLSMCLKLPILANTDEVKVACSRSHLNTETSQYVSNLKKQGKKISFIQAGSSLKFCFVAEGMADEYPRFGPTMEWDTAAGQAIVENAGGAVIDYKTGKRLLYNRPILKNDSFLVKRPAQ
jgi:3'(2'), 5'-bisphosphate nucleotidase